MCTLRTPYPVCWRACGVLVRCSEDSLVAARRLLADRSQDACRLLVGDLSAARRRAKSLFQIPFCSHFRVP